MFQLKDLVTALEKRELSIVKIGGRIFAQDDTYSLDLTAWVKQVGGVAPREKAKGNRNREHENKYRRDRRKMYQMVGICPYCRINRLAEGEKRCETCRNNARKKLLHDVLS